MSNTYTDTPISSHTLAADQPTIEANFLYLANTLGQGLKAGDHQINLNDTDTTTFEGRHIQSCYNNRHGSAPTVAGIADGTNALIYSDNGNLFFDSANQAGPYQLTTATTGISKVLFGANPNGWTFLPGGLIFQYGVIITGGSTSGTVNFPVTFPTAVLTITLGLSRTSSSSTQNAYVNDAFSIGPSSFHWSSTSNSTNNIWWNAIGY